MKTLKSFLKEFIPVFVPNISIKLEFLGNGDKKSSLGYKRTRMTRSRTTITVGKWDEWQATGDRWKPIQVGHKSIRVEYKSNTSNFPESEKGSKLDPLPEEKPTLSPTNTLTPHTSSGPTSSEPYRRVYPEWKPSSTLEKTDVVGTIEALAGMACKKYFAILIFSFVFPYISKFQMFKLMHEINLLGESPI